MSHTVLFKNHWKLFFPPTCSSEYVIIFCHSFKDHLINYILSLLCILCLHNLKRNKKIYYRKTSESWLIIFSLLICFKIKVQINFVLATGRLHHYYNVCTKHLCYSLMLEENVCKIITGHIILGLVLHLW